MIQLAPNVFLTVSVHVLFVLRRLTLTDMLFHCIIIVLEEEKEGDWVGHPVIILV